MHVVYFHHLASIERSLETAKQEQSSSVIAVILLLQVEPEVNFWVILQRLSIPVELCRHILEPVFLPFQVSSCWLRETSDSLIYRYDLVKLLETCLILWKYQFKQQTKHSLFTKLSNRDLIELYLCLQDDKMPTNTGGTNYELYWMSLIPLFLLSKNYCKIPFSYLFGKFNVVTGF